MNRGKILSENIANNVKELIRAKKLQPGDKLPNELEIADELNVSRSTVREAIKLLTSNNILEVRRGKGTFVSSKPGFMKDPLGINFIDKKHIYNNLFEASLLIEPELVGVAIDRITNEEIEELEEAFDKMQDKINRGENYTGCTRIIHDIIAKSTKNPIIERIIPTINVAVVKDYRENKINAQIAEKMITNYEKLIMAIKNKDREEAKGAMREVIFHEMRRREM